MRGAQYELGAEGSTDSEISRQINSISLLITIWSFKLIVI
jgi:hypothetical protein